MAVTYTDAQITELKTVASFNYEIASLFADKHKIPVRSVIAKVKSLEIPYVTKTPAEKKASATKKRTKADILRDLEVEAPLGLQSLDKMTAPDLEALLAYIKAINTPD